MALNGINQISSHRLMLWFCHGNLLEALTHLPVAQNIICTEYEQADIGVLHSFNKTYFRPLKNCRKSKVFYYWNINYGAQLKLVWGHLLISYLHQGPEATLFVISYLLPDNNNLELSSSVWAVKLLLSNTLGVPFSTCNKGEDTQLFLFLQNQTDIILHV